MTIGDAPANSSSEESPAAPAVPSPAPPSWPWRRAGRWPRYPTRDRAAIAAALIAPLAAAAILLPFRGSWSNTNAALLLVVVVVAVAAIGNRIAGAIAAIGAAAWFDFFFTMPYYRFTILHASDITTFVLLLAVGVAVSQLAARARRLKVLAITDARYLAQIHETAALAQTARSAEAVIDHVRAQLTGLLGLADCRFEYGMLLGHPPRLDPDGTVRAGYGRWNVEESGLPLEEVELRVFGNGQYYGRFMLTPGQAPGRLCRRGWWPSHWPTRQAAASPPGRPPPAPGEERAGRCLASAA